MDYKHSNLDEVTQANMQFALYGDDDNSDVEYKERFWHSLDRFPKGFSKKKKQQLMYSKTGNTAGHRLFTLKELADDSGRVYRRYVSDDRKKLNEYIDNNYHFLFIDIDDWVGFHEKTFAIYEDMVDLVSKFDSFDFPEVYVRPSTSTEDKPWKMHWYVRCRDPFYYRVPVGGGEHRREREHSLVLPENKMVAKFLKTFMDAFPEYFKSHQLAKVDSALYSIHQCLQGAPATDITKVTRSVLPDTVIGQIPTKETKRDIYFGVPVEYRNIQPYPCTSSMRFEAWEMTLLPQSFDVRLPSLKIHSDFRVKDGSRHRFACKLARDLWVAVHFNLAYYRDFAEPYDAERLFRWTMCEVFLGADMDGANVRSIEAAVRNAIKRMDADERSIEQILKEDYADTVKRNEKGRVIADPYKIAHFNRTSHKHVFWAISFLKKNGYIKCGPTLSVRGAELTDLLSNLHITRQTLAKYGFRFRYGKPRQTRSDKGKSREPRSLWAEYLELCRRDVDGRVIVPLDVGALPRFRKFASRQGIRYVSSQLPSDDPLNIDSVVDMPQDTSWIEPWPPEEVA